MKKILKEDFNSSNLYEKVLLLKENEANEIYKGLKWVVNNNCDVAVIGGIALVYYLKNSRNLTPDIDFLSSDISSIKSKLDNDNIFYNDLKGDTKSIGITVKKFNTDFLNINAGNHVINRLILKTAKKVKIFGYDVKIIIPELLAIMKIELGRNKDIDDGLALITSKTLNKDVYLKLINGLKNFLNDYDSLLSYIKLMWRSSRHIETIWKIV